MPSTAGLPETTFARRDGVDLVPAVILDTNVVLDWLVFRNPCCAGWTGRFADRSVRWLVSEPMRDELAHVLGRGIARAWQPDLPTLWSTWRGLATPVGAISLAGAATRVRCTDADDQKFVDLALGHRARWLISRDRAVLRLARRVRPLGLDVMTPEAWEVALSGG